MKITKLAFNTILLSTSLIVGQLQAATPLPYPEGQPLGTIGPIELSNSDLTLGNTKAYRTWFENGAWQGDLIEYDVDTNGLLDTSINLGGPSPVQDGGSNWSAHVQFATKGANYYNERKIITRHSDSGAQIPFRWGDLSDDQVAAIGDIDILNFIRGDRSAEKPDGPLRSRLTILGDIVHSNPEYVGAPDESFADSSYTAFKNTYLDREPRVYVGANDGMLHAFDAATGDEVWAYVPSMLFYKLRLLAGTPYAHRYYVDGSITVRDAKLNGDWSTVLIGSLGAGGKGLYALDVTDPEFTSELLGGTKLIGELGADDPDHGNDIGYIFDATTITQLNDGEWYAINGNGINSVNGDAKLLLIKLSTGDVIPISTGTAGSSNGLAAPALVDIDGDDKADIAYAGDINGDMWKFDLTGTNPNGWGVAYRVFDNNASQPITMAPDITSHPLYGFLVLYGTGKLYEPNDVYDTTVQALYGIWDKGISPSVSEAQLLQSLSGELVYDRGTQDQLVRTFDPVQTLDYSSYNGWYVNLPAGDRVLTQPAIRTGRLKATVTNPDGFSNWFMEVTFDEGSADDAAIFDLNGDGLRTMDDHVLGNGDDDYTDLEDIPMAWKREDGNMSQVTIASLGPGEDTLFLNFLNPPLIEEPVACSGSCDGGLIGGHMDVDTDDEYKGKTGSHKHEYDVKTNRTYIDYFDIDPLGEDKPQYVTDIVTDSSKKFIVTIANADWSPGGELRIGNVSYNVVAYQAMLHQALAEWKPGHPTKGDLEDPQGNPLIHTLDSIREDDGTLRITFLADALSGGLVPNKTGCVKGDLDDNLVSDRWRGNALTMHLVDADYVANVSATEQPLDRLRVQSPGALYSRLVLSDGTIIALTDDKDNDGLEGDSPEYEIYGGLTAANEESFLYESTVFWHWNDKDADQPDICWSDTDAYRQEFKNFTARIPVAFFLDRLQAETDFETFEELLNYVDSLQSCRNTANSAGGCRDEWEAVEELYDYGMLVHQIPRGEGSEEEEGYVDGQSGDLSGAPIDGITSGVSLSGKTSGPNFESGRRTWIDILAE